MSLNSEVSPTGTTKNRPMASARAATTVPTHMPLEIGSSSSSSCSLAEMPSAVKPIFSDSTSATTPRMIGQRSTRWRFVHETSGNDWTPISPSASSGAALGRGLADRDGPRRDAAHHHALEHRLPADGRILLRHQGAVWQAGLRHMRLGG